MYSNSDVKCVNIIAILTILRYTFETVRGKEVLREYAVSDLAEQLFATKTQTDVEEKPSFDNYTQTYNINYSCLLIPRFPSHQIKGDLADLLPKTLQQICISFGWRLDHIFIDINYLHWTLTVPPATAPNHFMKQIRKHLSAAIFSNFGRIRRENLSNCFWAPSDLVLLGNKPHPINLIEQYIKLIRKQQGLNSF